MDRDPDTSPPESARVTAPRSAGPPSAGDAPPDGARTPLDARPRPRPGPLGIAGRVGVFLGVFLLTGAVFRAVASPGGGGLVGSKLEAYLERPDRYDTVFVGSSHVFRSFVPEEFDRLLAERDVPASSFNLGVQMPSLLESHYLVRRVLAASGKGLRRVFVEYLPLTPQIDPAQAFIPRVVHWHDAEETAYAAERVLALSEGGLEVAPLLDPATRWSLPAITERALVPGPERLVTEHVEHFLHRLTAVGRVKDVVRGALGLRHGLTASMVATRGYVSLEEEDEHLAAQGRTGIEDNPFARRRAAFLEDLGRYHDLVRRLSTEDEVFGDEEWLNADLLRVHDVEPLRRMAEECTAQGAQLVVVLMPGLSCDRAVEVQLLSQSAFAVLRYNVPDEVPELYAVERRFDTGHPSREGALAFTRRLAADYLRLSTP